MGSAKIQTKYSSTTIRMSDVIREAVQSQARLEKLSTNAFIMNALDDYLQSKLRPSFEEIDPGFMKYLRREA